MVLNTGEVPNLFATEEKTEILERVQVNFHLFLKIWKQSFETNRRLVLILSPF